VGGKTMKKVHWHTLALLSIIHVIPDSFNSSETSEEWKKVYSTMVVEYCTVVGVQARQSTTLQSHFVELYGGLKQGIRELSLIAGAPKCPLVKFNGDDVDVQVYTSKVFEFIVSNPKKCCPVKWWSIKVVEKLLQLHLAHLKSFGFIKQDPSFLAQKQQEQRSKFVMDLKNREALLKEKRQLEDNERKEATKSRKVLAESSLKLADFLSKILDSNDSSDELLAAVNLDEKLGSFLAQMGEMLKRNHSLC